MVKTDSVFNVVVISLIIFNNCFACTGFSIKSDNHILACFNFDFQFGDGHIYLNKKNVERRRYLLYAERPVQWVSKYGSITFNVAGVNMPHDGMNEAGLVVLSMGLDNTKFTIPDSRPAIDENGWIQYQLDNSANIDDVITSMKKVRISNRCIGDSHFLITDSTGNSLVVEYINGIEKNYKGVDLPYSILANDTYSNMLNYLHEQKEFGGIKEDKFRVGSSCSRFAYIASQFKKYNPMNKSLVDFGFSILNDVRRKNTQYQVIYDITNGSIAYKSHNLDDVKTILFSEMNFDCDSTLLMTDIQSSFSGNIKNQFTEYASQTGKEELIKFNKNTFEYLPDEVLYEIANLPATSNCGKKKLNLYNDCSREKSLTASLKQAEEKEIVIPEGTEDNIIKDFQIELNKFSKCDNYFTIEIFSNNDMIPGVNVFITPNPVLIEKDTKSGVFKVIFISKNLKKGFEGEIKAKILPDGLPVVSENLFSIKIKRE